MAATPQKKNTQSDTTPGAPADARGTRLLVVHGVAQVVRVVLEVVLRVHLLLVLLVLRLILLRLLHHALDVLLAEAPLVVGDGDLVALARALVLRAHVEDAVGVNVEAHADLRHAARRGRDARELELSEEVVVARELALTLVHLHRVEAW